MTARSQPRRRPRRVAHEEVGLQIAPMIDVTLLLLFFFMLTGKLTTNAKLKEISLPNASAVKVPDNIGDRVIVNIDHLGQLYSGDAPVSEKELTRYLGERFKNFPLKLYVRADAGTPAKRIKSVMKMAAEAGAIEVVFGVLQGVANEADGTPQIELQIAPMIDVCFLLLFFYILTSKPVKPEADVSMTLPGSVAQEQRVDIPDEQRIAITDGGQVILNDLIIGEPGDARLPRLVTTLTRFREAADANKTEALVTLDASDAARHQRIVDVLNACAEAGVNGVTFADAGADAGEEAEP